MLGEGEQVDGSDTADREHDEEEIWRDLVSRLGGPPDGEQTGKPPPWPVEESLGVRFSGVRVIKPADGGAAGEPAAEPGEPFTEGPADSDEHYIPPPPPPLPHLDAVTKAAWMALFGGPAYLLVATIGGWPVPAWAAFCGVAAFVGGFITLVLRMSDDGRDASGPDDGAVA